MSMWHRTKLLAGVGKQNLQTAVVLVAIEEAPAPDSLGLAKAICCQTFNCKQETEHDEDVCFKQGRMAPVLF